MLPNIKKPVTAIMRMEDKDNRVVAKEFMSGPGQHTLVTHFRGQPEVRVRCWVFRDEGEILDCNFGNEDDAKKNAKKFYKFILEWNEKLNGHSR